MAGLFSTSPELKCFIAVYTNEVKDYCDDRFFRRLKKLSAGNPVHIIDNSQNKKYIDSLRLRFSKYSNFHFFHMEMEKEPKESLFHRSVTDSILLLRQEFLKTTLDYFLIIESDVIPPRNLLRKFQTDVVFLNLTDGNWGILGALYHRNFHKYALKGIQRTHHVLSGCTVYKREVIEKYPFRWSVENTGAFPDAWISLDAKREFSLYNDHRIQCGHLENAKTGNRYSRPL